MAYDRIEPFGEERDDLRAGIIASTVYNTMRGKGAPMLKPSDFMWSYEPRRLPSLEELTLKLESFADAVNSRKAPA